MITKQIGDIAEYKVIAMLLSKGYDVLLPCGDRLLYDIALDINFKLVRIQVKSAYKIKNSYMANTRRVKTNRKVYKTTPYQASDFDFAVVYIPKLERYYILPSDVFCSFKGAVSFSDSPRNKVAEYEDRWDLLCGLDK